MLCLDTCCCHKFYSIDCDIIFQNVFMFSLLIYCTVMSSFHICFDLSYFIILFSFKFFANFPHMAVVKELSFRRLDSFCWNFHWHFNIIDALSLMTIIFIFQFSNRFWIILFIQLTPKKIVRCKIHDIGGQLTPFLEIFAPENFHLN